MGVSKLEQVLCCILLALMVMPVAAGDWPQVGDEAPDFTLTDHTGKQVSLSDHVDKIRILIWISPTCAIATRFIEKGVIKQEADLFARRGLVWLFINSEQGGRQSTNATFHDRNEIGYPVLDDHLGRVARQYGVSIAPHLIVIDQNGYIVYSGAIDNDPTGEGGNDKTSYLNDVLESFWRSKPPLENRTEPYGCQITLAGAKR